MKNSVRFVTVLAIVFAVCVGTAVSAEPAPGHVVRLRVDPGSSAVRFLPSQARDVINSSFDFISATCTNCATEECPPFPRTVEVVLRANTAVPEGFGVSDLRSGNFTVADVTYSTQGPLAAGDQVTVTIEGGVLNCDRWFSLFFSMCDEPPADPAVACPSQPPTVESPVQTTGTSGDILLTYTLSDPDTPTGLSIAVEYRGGSVGSSWTSATITGATSGLSPGAGQTVIWSSAIDEPGVSASDYEVRITPFDLNQGTPGLTNPFAVDNNPAVTNVATTGSSGDITIDYYVYGASPPFSIIVEYRGGSVGAVWTSATVAGATAGLTNGPQVITWWSAIDQPGFIAADYQVRITPSDGSGPGAPGLSPLFAVDNSLPPTVETPVHTTGMLGDITLTYNLTDPDTTTGISITVDYRGGSAGATWTSATVTGTTSGLSPGAGQTVIWSSAIDEPGVSASDYEVRITPFDPKQGTPGLTNPFAVDNNPAVTNVATTGSSGDITIDYYVYGASPPFSIFVEYRGGSVGAVWTPATVAGATAGLTNGPQVITWRSAIDQPGFTAADYQVRITPSDGSGPGAPGLSGLFAVDNAD